MDAALLCTSGMYSMAAVGKDWRAAQAMAPCDGAKRGLDCRVPLLPATLQRAASVDLIDFHVYDVPAPIAGKPWTLAADLASSDSGLPE